MIATRPRPPRIRPSTADAAPTASPVRATTGPTRPRVATRAAAAVSTIASRAGNGSRRPQGAAPRCGADREQETDGGGAELRDVRARDHGHGGDLRRGGHDAHAFDRRPAVPVRNQ